MQVPNPVSQIPSEVLISPNGIAIAVVAILGVILILILFFFLRIFQNLLHEQSTQLENLKEDNDSRREKITELQQWKDESIPTINRFEQLHRELTEKLKAVNGKLIQIEQERADEKVQYQTNLNMIRTEHAKILAEKDAIIQNLTNEKNNIQKSMDVMSNRIKDIEEIYNLYPIVKEQRDKLEEELATLRPRMTSMENLLRELVSEKPSPQDIFDKLAQNIKDEGLLDTKELESIDALRDVILKGLKEKESVVTTDIRQTIETSSTTSTTETTVEVKE